MRENFFSLFLRSYRIAEKQGKGLAVYHSCADLVHRLCGERWAQHTIFPAELALARRFLDETGLAQADPAAAVQLNLMANPWAFTWTEAKALAEGGPEAPRSRAEDAGRIELSVEGAPGRAAGDAGARRGEAVLAVLTREPSTSRTFSSTLPSLMRIWSPRETSPGRPL